MVIPVFLCNDADFWYLLLYINVLLIRFEVSNKNFKSDSYKGYKLIHSLKILFPARYYLSQSLSFLNNPFVQRSVPLLIPIYSSFTRNFLCIIASNPLPKYRETKAATFLLAWKWVSLSEKLPFQRSLRFIHGKHMLKFTSFIIGSCL